MPTNLKRRQLNIIFTLQNGIKFCIFVWFFQPFWKCNFPMSPNVCSRNISINIWLAGWFVGLGEWKILFHAPTWELFFKSRTFFFFSFLIFFHCISMKRIAIIFMLIGFFPLSTKRNVCLSLCLSVCLFIYLSIYLSIHL